MVSTRRRVPPNWVSCRTLLPTTEPVVASVSVQSDFLLDGKVSGLGTVHPLLILSFLNTWYLTHEKRKTLSSVMDGFKKSKSVCHRIDTAVGINAFSVFVLKELLRISRNANCIFQSVSSCFTSQ